ncbi:bifunctional DNA primase/polymerase [Halobacillus yeomjeoni]|uniref:Bifunctional DNA primase/polymerase n=1 Tax=Halobacillus yeomjeoni TaxID=311194 RepID=A0A931HSL1_9BACI|nr:bifunctional DNA primase/polymerase [Halobacillus yeomjeoni]MBH0228835.1 bifunctional DNA primase/polymerase [Halobacillus yeomjeoni]
MINSILAQKQEDILYKSALAYVELFNWPVFPLKPKSKTPLFAGGFHNATRDVSKIKQWWTEHPEANIGLPTGDASGISVLDVDPRNGGDSSIEKLIEKYEDLPDTVTCLTAGGGQHYYFLYDKRINKSKLQGYEGLDLQGRGKYVILPPSIHPNCRKYEWELSSRPTDTSIVNVPQWLIELAGEDIQTVKKPLNHWKEILGGIMEGGRNEATASLAGYLLRKGLHPEVAYEITYLWNKGRNTPPLSDDEMDRTFNSIFQSEVGRLKKGRY